MCPLLRCALVCEPPSLCLDVLLCVLHAACVCDVLFLSDARLPVSPSSPDVADAAALAPPCAAPALSAIYDRSTEIVRNFVDMEEDEEPVSVLRGNIPRGSATNGHAR